MNVLAGGGSSLTVPLMIFMGMDSILANGTNRVAVVIQNVSGIWSFKKRQFSDFPTSLKLSLITLPGAIAGAIFAVSINAALFEKIIGIVILGVIITILLPTQKNDIQQASPVSNWLQIPFMFLVGLYGGFIQIGVGFLIMAALKYSLRTNLVRVNMHKVFIVLIFSLPTILIFALSGKIDWVVGLLLSTGNAFGAWWAAKLAVKKGEQFIRLVLIFAMLLMAAKLLGFF